MYWIWSENPRICPIWVRYDTLWAQIWSPRAVYLFWSGTNYLNNWRVLKKTFKPMFTRIFESRGISIDFCTLHEVMVFSSTQSVSQSWSFSKQKTYVPWYCTRFPHQTPTHGIALFTHEAILFTVYDIEFLSLVNAYLFLFFFFSYFVTLIDRRVTDIQSIFLCIKVIRESLNHSKLHIYEKDCIIKIERPDNNRMH